MTKRDQFLSGEPFKGSGLILTQFRFDAEGGYIEMQVFGPVADQWVYYGLVRTSNNTSFILSMLVLGETLVEREYLYDELQFLPEVIQEGGPDVGV